MPNCERSDIWFDSADGRSRIAGYFYEDPAAPPFCVVQLCHGMQEYVGRYAHFAAFLTEQGAALCGNDFLGHGSSVKIDADLGYFSGPGGRGFALADVKTMNDLAHQRYPGVPVVLLGHSMGSFYARRYATQWPETIDGLIISGTGGPNPLAGVGIALAKLLGRLKGDRYRSLLLQNLTFGGYLKRITRPHTIYDWLTRDEAIVAAYAKDPKCSYVFTVNGYSELYAAVQEVSGPAWAAALPKDLPVMMIQGGQDPVGGYGEGTAKVRGWLREAGVKHLEYKLYPDDRHEVLNELDRATVYADVLAFLRRWCVPAA